MSFSDYLLKQFPHCTSSPLKKLMSREDYAAARKRSIEDFGENLLGERCGNVWNCTIVNQGCLGRPYPDYPEVEAALKRGDITYKRGHFKDLSCLYVESRVECAKCPYMAICGTPCGSVESYMERESSQTRQPKIVNYESFERSFANQALESSDTLQSEFEDSWREKSIAWGCLTDIAMEIVQLRYYQNLQDWQIAKKVNKTTRDVNKVLSRALSRLSKYSKAQELVRQDPTTHQFVVDYYLGYMTQSDIAKKHRKSQCRINKILKMWEKSSGLSG